MRALITGISGQDGKIITKLLQSCGYQVFGTSRSKQAHNTGKTKVFTTSLYDKNEVFQLVNHLRPDKIFHFACQSSVSMSFTEPAQTTESIILPTLNLLEAVRNVNSDIKLFNAGSAEMFGNQKGRASIQTSRTPVSPYGIGKSTSFEITKFYRDTYGVFTNTGIFYNHESLLRNHNFVTVKVAREAARIALGLQCKLEVGDISVIRDWGWAEEYMEAALLMLNKESPEDLIIATGKSYPLRDYISEVFSFFALKPDDHIQINQKLTRTHEIRQQKANISNTFKCLGWRPKKSMHDVALELSAHQKVLLAKALQV